MVAPLVASAVGKFVAKAAMDKAGEVATDFVTDGDGNAIDVSLSNDQRQQMAMDRAAAQQDILANPGSATQDGLIDAFGQAEALVESFSQEPADGAANGPGLDDMAELAMLAL